MILRGVKNENITTELYPVNVISDVFSPFDDEEKFYRASEKAELKIIVSNTTEAGICFSDKDSLESELGGVYLLPIELI